MNILILTGRYGLGHIKCAEAIREMIFKEQPDAGVAIVDLIDTLFPKLNKAVYGYFNLLVTRLPHTYNGLTRSAGKHFSVPVTPGMLKKMDALMSKYQPDLVIADLPACGQYYSAYCKARHCSIPLYVYVTDITFHDEWAIPGTAHYFVGDDSTKNALAVKVKDPDIIHVSGIPVSAKLADRQLKTSKSILVMGGGLGQLPCETALLEALNRLDGVQVNLVCGSNIKLLRRVTRDYRHIRAFGLTDKVPDLMNRASAIMTKPGGMTTFEAIKSRTPLLVIAPKLEQEIGNARFIAEHCIGRVLSSTDDLNKEIAGFVHDKSLLEVMRENMEVLSARFEDANPLRYFS